MSNVLIVDDSSIARREIQAGFMKTGHQTFLAGDGLEAWETFSNNSIDVIFTDINMPKMNGLDFIARVRGSEKGAKIPIFVISTEINAQLKNSGKALGVIAWIAKPVSVDVLLSVLEKIKPQSVA